MFCAAKNAVANAPSAPNNVARYAIRIVSTSSLSQPGKFQYQSVTSEAKLA